MQELAHRKMCMDILYSTSDPICEIDRLGFFSNVP